MTQEQKILFAVIALSFVGVLEPRVAFGLLWLGAGAWIMFR